MFYAITVQNNIITGVHESEAPITETTFVANPDMADHIVIPLEAPLGYQIGNDIRTYKEDGTEQSEAWLIENAYMELPKNTKIVADVLVDWYKVFVQVDANGMVTAINSDIFLTDLTGWIQVDEGNTDRERDAQANYLIKSLTTIQGVYQYKLVAGKAVERTPEEIAADIALIPPPPPTQDAVMKELIALLISQGVI